jgi:hypothetical protein
MYKLPSTIPDVKMLLALAPEALRVWLGGHSVREARSAAASFFHLGPIDRHQEFLAGRKVPIQGWGDALLFAIWSPNPYEIPVSPNQSAPREPHGGPLAISSDRTQHGRD